MPIFAANYACMKAKWFYIFTFYLLGIFAIFYSHSGNSASSCGSKFSVAAKSCTTNPEKPFTGDSPFIRFHSGIDENGISISSPNVLVISLKPENTIPEKLIGIKHYLFSLSFTLPVTREFLYSTPLRSPPVS